MAKAEEYIKAYTRGCSNELVGGGYQRWLPVEDALAAVELAREEMMKDAVEAKCFGIWNDKSLCSVQCQIHLVTDGLKIGDKVKVIIIKD